MPSVLIVAGGTGGHIMPAVAVADHLRALGVSVYWMGASGQQNHLIPKEYPLHVVHLSGIRRKNPIQIVWSGLRLFRCILSAYFFIKKIKPDVILTMGGYVAAPGGVAAWMAGVPFVVHEQNTRAGLTNRCLAPWAKTCLQAFDGAFSKRIHTQTVGNPIRSFLLNLPEPEHRFLNRSGPLRVLIVGGSQGARAINQAVVSAVRDQSIEIWHQTGSDDAEWVRDQYRARRAFYRVDAFIQEMDTAYLWADCIISRSGALSICEISAVGLASILIPFPQSADQHQESNAQFLIQVGAAFLIHQDDSLNNNLNTVLDHIQGDRSVLVHMAQKARSVAKTNATDSVVRACFDAMDNKK